MKLKPLFFLLIVVIGAYFVLHIPIGEVHRQYRADKAYSVYGSTYLYASLFMSKETDQAGKIYLYDELEKRIIYSCEVDAVSLTNEIVWENNLAYFKDNTTGITANSPWVLARPIQAIDSITTTEKIKSNQVSENKVPSFVLNIPSGKTLKKLLENDFEFYDYLNISYKKTSEVFDVQLVGPGDDAHRCAFKQQFEFGIRYARDDCNEDGGGLSEIIVLPKTDRQQVKKLINLLFKTSDNTWTSPTTYEPDGAGCYYTIIEDDKNTTIKRWCGC